VGDVTREVNLDLVPKAIRNPGRRRTRRRRGLERHVHGAE